MFIIMFFTISGWPVTYLAVVAEGISNRVFINKLYLLNSTFQLLFHSVYDINNNVFNIYFTNNVPIFERILHICHSSMETV